MTLELQPVFLVLPDDALFARQAMLSCFARGESPLALRIVFASVLDTKDERERQMADRAADAWMNRATKVICFTDRGITPLMISDLKIAVRNRLDVEFRRVDLTPAPLLERLHQLGVPHSPSECALCQEPFRQAQERELQRARAATAPTEVKDAGPVQSNVPTFDEQVQWDALARSREASETERNKKGER